MTEIASSKYTARSLSHRICRSKLISAVSDLFNQNNLLVLFAFSAGLLSVFQLLEFFVTKNIPWLFRLIRSVWRSVQRSLAGGAPADSRKLILNFSGHPVLPGQVKAITRQMRWASAEVIDVALGNVAEDHKFVSEIEKAIDKIDLSAEEWQTTTFVVVPAGYSAVWTVIQAILHGRLGHFPDVVRLRPAPPLSFEKFEVAEIMNLHEVRHHSREKR